MGYFLDKEFFGKRIAMAIFMGRFFLAFVCLCIFTVAGAGLTLFWVIREIVLELKYQHRYGDLWRVEFERYHGSLSQVHTRLTVAIVCLLALAAILVWWIRNLSHGKNHGGHNAA